jgi:large subunit ribosomal protein L17
MRHRKDGRQFSRNTPHRRAMFRNLAGNLITHERIVTTDAKAKELRRVAEKLITKAKRLGPTAHTPQTELSDEQKAKRLHVVRLLNSFLPKFGVDREGEKTDLAEKVLCQLSKRFADRPGGYTRIVKLGARRGDGANMAIIEFVDTAPPAPKYEEASIGGAEAEAAPAADADAPAKAESDAAEAKADEAEDEPKAAKKAPKKKVAKKDDDEG